MVSVALFCFLSRAASVRSLLMVKADLFPHHLDIVSVTLYCVMYVFSLENPNAPKPWTSERGGGGGDERHKVEDMEFMRRREFYDRYARLEELERMYYDRYPPSMPPPPARDIYHDRYLDRPLPPPRDPYFERYRHAEMERSRFHHERPPMGGSVGNSFERAYYESRGERSYDRPRDDPYDRREPKDAFRDREPFERFESSRRL